MLINSINWLIDCKKALTSRQPTKLHMAAILAGACADVSVCRALALAQAGGASWDVQCSARLACLIRLVDEIVVHITGDLGKCNL